MTNEPSALLKRAGKALLAIRLRRLAALAAILSLPLTVIVTWWVIQVQRELAVTTGSAADYRLSVRTAWREPESTVNSTVYYMLPTDIPITARIISKFPFIMTNMGTRTLRDVHATLGLPSTLYDELRVGGEFTNSGVIGTDPLQIKMLVSDNRHVYRHSRRFLNPLETEVVRHSIQLKPAVLNAQVTRTSIVGDIPPAHRFSMTTSASDHWPTLKEGKIVMLIGPADPEMFWRYLTIALAREKRSLMTLPQYLGCLLGKTTPAVIAVVFTPHVYFIDAELPYYDATAIGEPTVATGRCWWSMLL